MSTWNIKTLTSHQSSCFVVNRFYETKEQVSQPIVELTTLTVSRFCISLTHVPISAFRVLPLSSFFCPINASAKTDNQSRREVIVYYRCYSCSSCCWDGQTTQRSDITYNRTERGTYTWRHSHKQIDRQTSRRRQTTQMILINKTLQDTLQPSLNVRPTRDEPLRS